MDVLALVILASLVGVLLIGRVIISTTDRAAEGAITRYFKASEHILKTGQPPPDWYEISLWRRLIGRAAVPVSQDEIMARLDELIRFFEGCRFFEDEWTREQLLSQLADVRDTWQNRVTL